MAIGTVKWWDDNKGFGFIVWDSENIDVFVHANNIQCDGYASLEEGQLVEFEPAEWVRGYMAENVREPGAPIDNALLPQEFTSSTQVKVFQSNSIRRLEYDINEWLEDRDFIVESVSMTESSDGVKAIVVYSYERV